MNNIRSNKILVSYKSSPAVHYIPSNTNSLAFGDAVSIGAKTSGILSFKKSILKMIKKQYNDL